MRIFIVFICFLGAIQNSFSQLDIDIVTENFDCSDCTGTITIIAFDDEEPYKYSIDDGQTLSFDNVFEDLCTGVYNIYVEANNGNAVWETVNIEASSSTLAFDVNIINTGNTPAGIIEISILGGTPPYQVTINETLVSAETVFSDLSAGDYDIEVMDSNGCIVDQIVTLNLFDVDNTVTVTGDTLRANATDVTYQWINADTGEPISGATQREYQVETSGNYRVEMFENATTRLNNPNIFTSPVYNIDLNALSTNNFELDNLSVYPNPTYDKLILPITSINKSYEIFDITGKRIINEQLNENIISTSKLNSGVYFIKVEGFNISKFIKK